MRGSWRPNRTAIYWPPLWWPSALCLSRSPGLLKRRPRGPALCWMMAFFTASYHQLVSKTPSEVPRASRPGVAFPSTSCLRRLWSPTQSGAPWAPLAWRGCPYHISSLTPTVWLLVLTELYNSSTPTQSPTQPLEWHVWSPSSGNNCYTIHRSLSSGAAQWDLHLVPYYQPSSPARFLSINGQWDVYFRYLWNGMFARAKDQNTTQWK